MTNKLIHSMAASRKVSPMTLLPIPSASRGDESVEIVYAEQIANSATIAARDGILYCWTGDHWQAQEENHNIMYALRWLSRFDRERATKATAKSCVETAMLLANVLPKKPHRSIIPLHGAWLVLDADNELIFTEPEREMGVYHTINATISANFGSHVTQAVPQDSLFGKYLNTSLPDPKVQELVQEFIGYTLTGHTDFQVAQLWVGAGSNGKSVLLNIVRALHAKPVAMELDKLDGFNRASLVGASLVTCDETPKGRINQQTLKTLISGGDVEINAKYRQPITYRPSAKWIICTNHIPALNDHSDGWWRRLQIIDWNVQVKGKDVIPDLDRRIVREELHIVLDWALAGLQKLYKRGHFEIPETVQAAKAEAMAESNSVLDWVDFHGIGVSIDPDPFTDKSYLYGNYVKYCDANGFMACNMSQCFKRLKTIFPNMKEKREVRGMGANRVRIRCVNLCAGQFTHAESQEAQEREQIEIDTVFGGTGHPADHVLLMNYPR